MSDFDGVSNAASAARFAMNPTPLGAAGLALGLGSMLGGKTKSKFIPGYENGKYTVNGQPYAPAEKFQIEGDKGSYDLVPMLNSAPRENFQDRMVRDMQGGAYDQSKALYERSRGIVADDPAALAKFDSTFKPSVSYSRAPGGYDGNIAGMAQAYQQQQRSGQPYNPFIKNYAGAMNPSVSPMAMDVTKRMTGQLLSSDLVGRDMSAISGYASKIGNPVSRPKQLAQALQAPTSYQAPNITYQAPSGSYKAPR